MGEAELNKITHHLIIRSHFVFYGDACNDEMASQIAEDISSHWNEPLASVEIKNKIYQVRFEISGEYNPALDPEIVWYNDDPRMNFFRIEEFVLGNISFVDGLNCNTGYFKLDNLKQTSTTAAHEYGHTIGLDHPDKLDIRGQIIPGIMYPRGTICDPHFQYDPNVAAGITGGTLDPRHRKVLQIDIDLLKLHKLHFDENGKAVVGAFSSIYHDKHLQ